jgi:predicted amidohydrolase YtcJ
VDGGYTGPAAWTLEHYRDQPDYYGKAMTTRRELYELVRATHDMGWQMGFHTIGDAAIKQAVEVFVQVLTESPRPDHRHYLNHFTVMPPVSVMESMAEHNILISQQPNFVYTIEGRYVANLVGERLQTNNPMRTPMSHGIFVAMASDIMPIGPMIGLYSAVERRGMSGALYGPGERISMPEAVTAYTRNGAYFTFEEDLKGSIEPGKLADIVVLSKDLLTMDPNAVPSVEVEMTILDGQIVYERE